MEEERRPVQHEELRSKPLTKEDAYFKKLEDERQEALKFKAVARRMVCGRADRPKEGCPLVHENRHGLIVDACHHCGGLWLDEHETELLKKSLTDVAPEETFWQSIMKNVFPYQG